MSTDKNDYLRQRWVPVVNDTDTVVPEYGVMSSHHLTNERLFTTDRRKTHGFDI